MDICKQSTPLNIEDRDIALNVLTPGIYSGGEIKKSKIRNCYIGSVNINNVRISHTKFEDIVACKFIMNNMVIGRYVRISGSHLHRGRINRSLSVTSHIRNSIIGNCIFDGVVFSNCIFNSCAFIDVTFHGCRFSNTFIKTSSFSGCTFNKCMFINYKDDSAPFQGCGFSPLSPLGIFSQHSNSFPQYGNKISDVIKNKLIKCFGHVYLENCYGQNIGVVVWADAEAPDLEKRLNLSKAVMKEDDGTFDILGNFGLVSYSKSMKVDTHKPDKNAKRAFRFFTMGV